MEEDKIYLHEDFYCQVELMPRENWDYLDVENQKIHDFAQVHYDGNGYTDIYLRGENKLDTYSRQIPLTRFEQILIDIGYQKSENVYTGYGSYSEKCEHTNAYKMDEAIIFCDYENGIIKNIWIDEFRFKNDSPFVEQMIAGLHKIGKQWNLVLNDWDLSEIIDLQNQKEIEVYIREK